MRMGNMLARFLGRRGILFDFVVTQLAVSLKHCALLISFNTLIINELEGIYNSTIYGGGVKSAIVKALAAQLSL